MTAYHGQGHQGLYPCVEDFGLSYKVTYIEQWTELSIVNSPVSTDLYKGVKVVMDSDTGNNLSVKMCGEEDGREQYHNVESPDAVYEFDPAVLGSKCKGVTLQFKNKGTYTTTVNSVSLIRKDGTEEQMHILDPYWGCSVELIPVKL